MNDKHGRNASRNLFSFIHQKNKTIPVPISSVTTPIRGLSRQKHIVRMKPWPLLYLSDWVRTAFMAPYCGFFLLAGYRLHQINQVKSMLKRFWERYAFVDVGTAPSHPESTIPFYLHGDEGRGQCHRPVTILSAQCVMGWGGENCVASKKKHVNCIRKFSFVVYSPQKQTNLIPYHLSFTLALF